MEEDLSAQLFCGCSWEEKTGKSGSSGSCLSDIGPSGVGWSSGTGEEASERGTGESQAPGVGPGDGVGPALC